MNNVRSNLAICFKFAEDSQILDTYVSTPLRFAESAEVTITASMLAVEYFLIGTVQSVCSDTNVYAGPREHTKPRQILALGGPNPLDDSIIEAFTDEQGGPRIGLFRKDFTNNGQPLPSTSIVQYFINLSPDVACSVSRQRGAGPMLETIPLLGSRNEDVDIYTSCESTTQMKMVYLFQCSGENEFRKNFTVNLNQVLGCEGAFNPFVVMGSSANSRHPPQLVRPRGPCSSEDATCRVQGTAPTPSIAPTVPSVQPTVQPVGTVVTQKVTSTYTHETHHFLPPWF